MTSEVPRAEVLENLSKPSVAIPGAYQTGVRRTRAGGAKCQADPQRSLQLTVDVWCDPRQKTSPAKIQAPKVGPEGEDPCEVYISLESSAGCVYYDTLPIMRVVGTLMVVGGICLNVFATWVNRVFLMTLIQGSVFLLIVALFH